MNVDPHIAAWNLLSHVKKKGLNCWKNFHIPADRSTGKTLLTLTHFSRSCKTHRTNVLP